MAQRGLADEVGDVAFAERAGKTQFQQGEQLAGLLNSRFVAELQPAGLVEVYLLRLLEAGHQLPAVGVVVGLALLEHQCLGGRVLLGHDHATGGHVPTERRPDPGQSHLDRDEGGVALAVPAGGQDRGERLLAGAGESPLLPGAVRARREGVAELGVLLAQHLVSRIDDLQLHAQQTLLPPGVLDALLECHRAEVGPRSPLEDPLFGCAPCLGVLLAHLQATEQTHRGCAGQRVRGRFAVLQERRGEESQDEQDGGVDLIGAEHLDHREDTDHHRDQQGEDGVGVASEPPGEPCHGPISGCRSHPHRNEGVHRRRYGDS